MHQGGVEAAPGPSLIRAALYSPELQAPGEEGAYEAEHANHWRPCSPDRLGVCYYSK